MRRSETLQEYIDRTRAQILDITGLELDVSRRTDGMSLRLVTPAPRSLIATVPFHPLTAVDDLAGLYQMWMWLSTREDRRA